MKRIISLVLLLTSLSASAITTDADGTYLISSAEDLCQFSVLVGSAGFRSANAMLTTDIDMTGQDLIFSPIGTSTRVVIRKVIVSMQLLR